VAQAIVEGLASVSAARCLTNGNRLRVLVTPVTKITQSKGCKSYIFVYEDLGYWACQGKQSDQPRWWGMTRRLWRPSYRARWQGQCGDWLSPLFSFHRMASLLGALLELLRILRSSVKDHIRRIPRSCWVLLLVYLSRKWSEWWCPWPRKPGTHGNTKPADPSFPGGRGSSCSVSCSSARHVARVAASTVPASANTVDRQSRDGAESQSSPSPPPISDTLPVDPSPDLNPISHWVGERSPTNHSSGNVSIQISGDRSSAISISRTSSRASVQKDRASQDPRAIHRQFGPGPGASRPRGRSSRSPSPQPSLINPQTPTGFPSPASSHTRDQLSSPAIHRVKQKTTSIDWDIQNPSTESLPNTSLPVTNLQQVTEALMRGETSTGPPSRISPAVGSETAPQHSHMASSAPPNHVMLPEGRIPQLINSDQIPRYTKNNMTQVHYFFHSHAVFTYVNRPRGDKLRFVKRLTTTFP